jgi:hypothetical protein
VAQAIENSYAGQKNKMTRILFFLFKEKAGVVPGAPLQSF